MKTENTKSTYIIHETVVEDTLAFRAQVDRYVAGDISAADFKGIRVPMGIYEQREDDTYMVRVRGAAGVFLPHQAKLVADLSRTYGNGIVHVTTRQDLQIHGVRIEDTPTILERLLELGLSPRGGGGNTVRNVSACPLAGVCSDEVFDVTPYALALTEYLIRERANFNLPRKFKVAFSGCGKDCSLSSVADLGFFAHERDGVRGFAVYAGGGMGARSALGILIEEFVPTEAIFEVAEAMKRLFDKHGDRTNRSRARLRFVVERLGEDEFRSLHRDELELVRREQLQVPAIRTAQHNDGISPLPVRLSLGDISASHLVTLAEIAQTLGDGTVRTTQEQDLQLRVTKSKIEDARNRVSELNPDYLRVGGVSCVSCAGASTCRLGICLSRDLATAIQAELSDAAIPIDAVVHISGCQNSCGQHPISQLGLFGSAARVDGKVVHFYNIVVGGHPGEGNAALAEPIAKVSADDAPAIVKQFWLAASANRQDGETMDDLMARWGVGYLRELCGKYDCSDSGTLSE